MPKRAEPRYQFSANVMSKRLLCCSKVVLSLLYVLISAKRADLSTISTFVNFLMNKRCPPKQPADMTTTTALRAGLNHGISSGNLVDTKVVLYSHRDSSGRVCRSKALYANSNALKTVPYFNDRESTATLNNPRAEPHISKSSSGTSQNPNQRTSARM